MTEQEPKTFTQQDIDNLKSELETKHQEDLNNLAGKLRAEFKEKEQKAKAEAEKAAKQAGMTELEKANAEIADWKAKYQEKEDYQNLQKIMSLPPKIKQGPKQFFLKKTVIEKSQ